MFSPFKPVIPTITFKDTMWTQALMSDKQVVKACRPVSSLGKAFEQKSFRVHLVPRPMRTFIIGRVCLSAHCLSVYLYYHAAYKSSS